MLAAALIQEIPNTGLQNDPVSIPLSSHFDDPDISGSTVEVTTPFGSILIETYDEVTPLTAANFLALVEGGNYDEMFFHRSVPGFVVQGGGFRWTEDPSAILDVEHNGTVVNEFANWFDPQIGGLAAGTPLNVRGTIAMAKLAGDPDSADSQWFVNLDDNSANLDGQNGGFTVFARVLPQSMSVLDAIAALPRINGGGAFTSMPVRDYQSGNQVHRENAVTSGSALVDELTFEVTANTAPDILTAAIVDGHLILTPNGGGIGYAQLTVTATDLQGQIVSATFEVAVQAPLTPRITGPADGSNLRPVIMWDDVPGAQNYQLWVNHVGVQNAVIHEMNLTTSEFTPQANLAPGNYTAWVRAANSFGLSDWSEPFSFVVESSVPAAVTITSPATGTTSELRPTIEWTASNGAEEYDLWVNHIGVQNQVIRQPSLSGTSFTPDADLPDGTYRVWVRAKNSEGSSLWSAAVTFDVQGGILRLISPNGEENPVRPRFSWNGATNGAAIELWVNKVGGPNRVLHESAITTDAFVPEFDLTEGEYRAWIREHLNGQSSEWSAAIEFSIGQDTTPGAVVLDTITGTETGLPTITWHGAANAANYELWINETGGQARIIHMTGITAVQYTAASSLSPGQYRGWLRAFNANGDSGAWSQAFTFVIS